MKVLLDPPPHSWKAAGRGGGEWEEEKRSPCLGPRVFLWGRNIGFLLYSSQGSGVTSYFLRGWFPRLPCSEGVTVDPVLTHTSESHWTSLLEKLLQRRETQPALLLALYPSPSFLPWTQMKYRSHLATTRQWTPGWKPGSEDGRAERWRTWPLDGAVSHTTLCVCFSHSLCPALCDPMGCSLQAPLSKEFFRQESRSVLPFPTPGDLPHPGIESGSPAQWADLYRLSHRRRLHSPGLPSDEKTDPLVVEAAGVQISGPFGWLQLCRSFFRGLPVSPSPSFLAQSPGPAGGQCPCLPGLTSAQLCVEGQISPKRVNPSTPSSQSLNRAPDPLRPHQHLCQQPLASHRQWSQGAEWLQMKVALGALGVLATVYFMTHDKVFGLRDLFTVVCVLWTFPCRS